MQDEKKNSRYNSKNGSLKKLDNLDDNKNPRNRIQAVHNVVKNGVEINEFDANYNVDQKEDKAAENDDEDFQNDDDKIVLNDDTDDRIKNKNVKDSNQAIETMRESYEQGDDEEGLDENEDGEDALKSLPPKDGSLKVYKINARVINM